DGVETRLYDITGATFHGYGRASPNSTCGAYLVCEYSNAVPVFCTAYPAVCYSLPGIAISSETGTFITRDLSDVKIPGPKFQGGIRNGNCNFVSSGSHLAQGS
ncbi:MAG: hypothetical protein WCA38_04900, partial [Candidatus Acidiferrales bacterium]